MATQREMHLLDIRIAERNIAKGLLTRKEWDKHIKDLPDATDKSEPVSERQPLEPAEEDEE
jgi:hypothetical protein